jgi:hypothetical protein
MGAFFEQKNAEAWGRLRFFLCFSQWAAHPGFSLALCGSWGKRIKKIALTESVCGINGGDSVQEYRHEGKRAERVF